MTRLLYQSLSCILCAIIVLSSTQTLRAQNQNEPSVRITDINVADFPDVEVSIYAANVDGPLASLPLQLVQDNTALPLVEDRLVDVGIQAAIVVDTARNILDRGNSGQPRLAEVTGAVTDLLQLGMLSAETDWLALHVASDADQRFRVVTDWQRDHQAVANELILYQPADTPPAAPLHELLKFTFDRFVDSEIPNQVSRSVVVFSSASDSSNEQLNELASLARSLDIRVHTVGLGPTNESDTNGELLRLAELTGGTYVPLNAIADARTIWDKMAAERSQRVVRYRLTEAEPVEVKAIITMPDGTEIDDSQPFPSVAAQPVEIDFVRPNVDFTLVRKAGLPDTPLKEMLPSTLPIQLKFFWPDGYPRSFRQVTFSLNGNNQIADAAPFDQIAFPVDSLADGDYTISVTAIDELGITSTGPSRSIRIELQLPDGASEVDSKGEAGGETDPTSSSGTLTSNEVSTAAKSTAASDANSGESTDGLRSLGGERVENGGFSLFGYRLPHSVEVAGITIPINRITLLAGASSLLLLLVLIIYFTRPAPTETPYDLSVTKESSGDVPHFYHEPFSATVPDLSIFDVGYDPTEPVRMLKFAAAYLVYDEGGEHLPKRLPLEEGQDVRIGRSSDHCELILEDRRVSRQHSTILSKDDGFYLQDDGSAGGTYLNGKRLGVEDELRLEHKDFINFNEITYQFQVVSRGERPTLIKDSDDSHSAVSSSSDTHFETGFESDGPMHTDDRFA